MGEDNDEGAGIEGGAVDNVVWPPHPQLIRLRESFLRDEGGPWVGHDGVKAEQAGMLHQLLGNVNRPEDEESRTRGDHLVEQLILLVRQSGARLPQHEGQSVRPGRGDQSFGE